MHGLVFYCIPTIIGLKKFFQFYTKNNFIFCVFLKGWAFYTSLFGLILTFVSSFISLKIHPTKTKDTNLKQVDPDKGQKGETIV